MTVKQEDFLSVFIKRVVPVLSILGTLAYFVYYAGGHFAIIEANQIRFSNKQDAITLHQDKQDTTIQNLRSDFRVFKQEVQDHWNIVDSRPQYRLKWRTVYKDANGNPTFKKP